MDFFYLQNVQPVAQLYLEQKLATKVLLLLQRLQLRPMNVAVYRWLKVDLYFSTIVPTSHSAEGKSHIAWELATSSPIELCGGQNCCRIQHDFRSSIII